NHKSSHFPHTTLFRSHARINYPARYADFDVSISHPVGRWQIDTIAFVKQSQQFGPGPAPAAPSPSAASLPPSAPPAGSAPPGSRSEEHTSELQSPDHL